MGHLFRLFIEIHPLVTNLSALMSHSQSRQSDDSRAHIQAVARMAKTMRETIPCDGWHILLASCCFIGSSCGIQGQFESGPTGEETLEGADITQNQGIHHCIL